MYVNRESRFYVSICFDNSKWVATKNAATCELYFGGNTGHTGKTRNYSTTGYILRKYSNPSVDWKIVRMCPIGNRLFSVWQRFI